MKQKCEVIELYEGEIKKLCGIWDEFRECMITA